MFFGIKGGVNFTNLYVSTIQKENIKVSCNAGFFARISLTNRLSLQPELLYISKGTRIKYNSATDGSGSYRFNFYYIETPLLLTLNLAPYISLSGGGYAGFITSANITNIGSDCTVKERTHLRENDFNCLDAGLVGGINFYIEKIMLGLRYDLGLRNIGYSNDPSSSIAGESKNNTASIFIGIAF